MAGEVKISALPLAGPAQDDDVTAGVQSGTTVKQTNAALYTYIDNKIGILPFSKGGFGFNTATRGDLFYASATDTPGKLADVATGSVLASAGVGNAPTWSTFPTISRLVLSNGNVPISSINAVVEISSAASDGTYFSLGGQTGSIGRATSGAGNLFFANNFLYNATSNAYTYASTGGGSSIEVGTSGGFLKYASSGTVGAPLTPLTALSWNTSGIIQIPNLTASSFIMTDSSKNLISPTDFTWDGSSFNVTASGTTALFNLSALDGTTANFAIIDVERPNSVGGVAGYQFSSAGVSKWLNGMYPTIPPLTDNADDLIFRSFTDSTVVMTMGQTSFDITIPAGNLIVSAGSKSVQIASLTASLPVFTDGSKNLVSTGVVPFSNGGFGFSTATTGDLFYASATNTPGKLADVATGQVLTSGGIGAAPVYSASPTLTSIGLGAAVTGPYSVYATSAGSVTSGGSAAYFGSGASATAGNLYGISIDKNGVDSLRIGINKNSATGQVPSNGAYISTFFSTSTLSIGRGSGGGLPSSGDIFIGSAGDVTIGNGDTIINTVGKTLKIKQGSNACAGTGVVMVAGTVTVNTTAAATGDIILLTKTVAGGVSGPGMPVITISNGVSFTITGAATDTSTWSWIIIKAA